jgi:alcohol dehydrogenase class IV
LNWVTELVRDLEISPLAAHGMTVLRIPEAVEKAMKASSARGNPIALNEAELTEILERAM